MLNTNVTVIETKIPNTSGLGKKTDFNMKNTEDEKKIPDTADFIRKTNFETKLNNIKNWATLNKTKQIEALKKQNDHITSCKKINELASKEISLVSTKRKAVFY